MAAEWNGLHTWFISKKYWVRLPESAIQRYRPDLLKEVVRGVMGVKEWKPLSLGVDVNARENNSAGTDFKPLLFHKYRRVEQR